MNEKSDSKWLSVATVSILGQSPSRIGSVLFRSRLLGLILLIFYSPLFAIPSVEQKIKVAYIYNFTKFITWPEHLSDTFNLCILGKHSFGSLFNKLESKTALGVPIKLVQLQQFDPSRNCQILFLEKK